MAAALMVAPAEAKFSPQQSARLCTFSEREGCNRPVFSAATMAIQLLTY
jgi:hypothetical protein